LYARWREASNRFWKSVQPYRVGRLKAPEARSVSRVRRLLLLLYFLVWRGEKHGMAQFWQLDTATIASLASSVVLEAQSAVSVSLESTPASLAESLPPLPKRAPSVIVLEFPLAPSPVGGSGGGGSASSRGASHARASPRPPGPAGEVQLVPFDMRGPSPREQLERAKALAQVEEGAVMRTAELVVDALRKRGWGAEHTSAEAVVATGSAEEALALLTPKDLKLAAAFEAFLGEQVSIGLANARRIRAAAARKGVAPSPASPSGGGGGGSPRGFSSPEAFEAEGSAPASSDEEMEVLRGLDFSALIDRFVVRLYYGLSRALMRSTAAGRAPSPARSPHRAAPPASPASPAPATAPASPSLTFSPFAGAIAAEASLPAPPPPLASVRVVAPPPLLLGQRFMRVAAVAHFRGTMAPPLHYADDVALALAKALQGAAFREPQPPPLVLAAATSQRLIASYGVLPRAAALVQFAAALRLRSEEIGAALACIPGAKPLAALVPPLPASELAALEGAVDEFAVLEEAPREPTAEEKEAEERELELADKVDVDVILANAIAKKRTLHAIVAARKERLEREFDFEGAKAEAKRYVKDLIEHRRQEAERRA
jgi:hypothetical protein